MSAIPTILLPGGGLRATEGINRIAPDTAIVVQSADEHRPTVLSFLRAGAIYHVRTGTEMPQLIQLLGQAMHASSRGEARS